MTLNEEMQNRNAELSSVNSDLLNLLDTVNLPVVMVSLDLRIRRFTPPSQKLLNLQPSDIGRRLGEIRTNLEFERIWKRSGARKPSTSAEPAGTRSSGEEWRVVWLAHPSL